MHIDNLDDYAASLTSDCAKVAYLKGYEKGLAKGKELAVKHGHWIEYPNDVTCSVCGAEWHYNDYCYEAFKYCPNCGAKIEGYADETD